VALDDGDELARAWDLVRQLGDQLTEARHTEDELRRELRAAHTEVESQRTRIAWLQNHIDTLQADLTDARQQNEDLAARLDQRGADAGRSTERLMPPGGNRAERRRAARRARRPEH
jgi:chromosome segregation ATPase